MATEQEKQEAAELAARAKEQSKHAAKNTGRAARKLATVAAEETGDVVEKVNDTAEEALADVEKASRKFITHRWTRSFTPLGRATLGAAIGIAGFSYAAWVSGRALRAGEVAKELHRQTPPQV